MSITQSSTTATPDDQIILLIDTLVTQTHVGTGTLAPPSTAFDIIDQLVDDGHDLSRFTADLLKYFHDLLQIRLDPTRKLTRGHLDVMVTQAEELGANRLLQLAKIVEGGLHTITQAASQRLSLELIVARLQLAVNPVTYTEGSS